MNKIEQLKNEIFEKVRDYYSLVHDHSDRTFTPEDRINYAGRVFDEKELVNLVDSSLEFWLTAGRYTDQFELKLADFLGAEYCFLTNSGSSANLLAFMTLTSPQLKERQIKRGDEVITVAVAFPTTVAPIIQYGAVPVFVDVEIPSYNIDVDLLEKAFSSKTKAVFLAHTLGNPFDLESVKAFCKKHNLWLIEDNCDSMGSKYRGKFTGTFGDIGTSSFYPPHHITLGEGGAVYTNDSKLNRIANSLLNWGRDCCCKSGQDDCCGKRFSQQFASLPYGYDHKYVFSHLGYNFKATEMQAAIGCAQLEKLPEFIEARKKNWQYLYDMLCAYRNFFILPEPQINSEPSWFGFMLTLKEDVRFTRNDLVKFLESKNIQTRMLFAGNITKHPCFDSLEERVDYRTLGNLENTDRVMNDSFWLGVYPGMGTKHLDYMISNINFFIVGR